VCENVGLCMCVIRIIEVGGMETHVKQTTMGRGID